jgi:hypothetical protein
MSTSISGKVLMSLAGAVACASTAQARPELISNGGFESGFAGWTRVQQLGSGGAFMDQTGTISPVNGLAVPAPPQGLHAAMTDAVEPGSHALYQDVLIPTGVTSGATLSFLLFINNTAAGFSTPASLDFSTPALNQQARVDIITTSADPFSVAGTDVLQNVFQTTVGAPLRSGYNSLSFDVSALLALHGGETLRVRFAETDNVNIFNFGVDAVSLNIVPAPGAGILLAPVVLLRRRSRR